MSRPRGGYIGFNRVPAATAWNSAASGVWTLREAEALKRAGTWPTVMPSAGLICNLDASVASSLFQDNSGIAATATDHPVGYWVDQSGLGNHATQIVGESRPLLKLANQNGLPGLLLDGANDFLTATIAGFQSLAEMTILLVFKTAPAAAADTNTAIMFGFGNYASGSAAFPAFRGFLVGSATGAFAGERLSVFSSPTPGQSEGRLGSSSYSRSASTAQALTLLSASTGISLLANNSDVTLDLSFNANASQNQTPAAIGYTNDDHLLLGAARSGGNIVYTPQMTIHQLIAYSRVLTPAERTVINAHLVAKWGLA